MEIIPAVLENSWKEVEKRLFFIEKLNLGNRWVQLDVTDGIFTSEKSWNNPADLKSYLEAKLPSVSFEIDLMVKNPEDVIESWIDAGAKRVVMHIETVQHRMLDIGRLSHGRQVEIGLAINIDTSNEALNPYLEAKLSSEERVDYVQFMGIEKIGYQGQPFDGKVLHKIEDLRTRFPDAIIQVDGGVNKETVLLLIKAGVNRLTVGSAIENFKDASSS